MLCTHDIMQYRSNKVITPSIYFKVLHYILDLMNRHAALLLTRQLRSQGMMIAITVVMAIAVVFTLVIAMTGYVIIAISIAMVVVLVFSFEMFGSISSL